MSGFTLDAPSPRINIRSLYAIVAEPDSRAGPFPHTSRIMMMAFDSSQNPPSRLSDDTTQSVRVALRGYLDSGSASKVQQALVQLAAEARDKSMPPERVLIALKEIWNSLPEVRVMADTDHQIRLLQRVVTMCIKEYYSA